MALVKENENYRAEMKKLSEQLDQELVKDSRRRTPEVSDKNAEIESVQKKITLLENEIKRLRAASPRTSGIDRLTLETNARDLREEIKIHQNANRELSRKIEDAYRKTQGSSSETAEKQLAELRSAREKIKIAKEKYLHDKKIHEQNRTEILKLESALKKTPEQIDYLKFESRTENFYPQEIEIIKNVLNELENQKKQQDLQLKQESEKLVAEVRICQEKIDILQKDLKGKVHEIKLQDYEINNFKRKLRSISTKRFSTSPDFELDEAPVLSKLSNVKSESKLPPRPRPRLDSSSPAAQRIKQLRSDIEKVTKIAESLPNKKVK